MFGGLKKTHNFEGRHLQQWLQQMVRKKKIGWMVGWWWWIVK
jgi:hypothetical protein